LGTTPQSVRRTMRTRYIDPTMFWAGSQNLASSRIPWRERISQRLASRKDISQDG
jgi:hypothetical protein